MEEVQYSKTNIITEKLAQILEKKPVILQLLKFIAIGVINTALDFIVLNFLISEFKITSGKLLGWVNIPGFILAVSQSYFWNRYWTFEKDLNFSILKNFLRLVVVGVVGGLVFLLTLVASSMQLSSSYFLVILGIFIVCELCIWHNFGFFAKNKILNDVHMGKFTVFFGVSGIGLLINTTVIVLITSYISLSIVPELNANFAKVLATIFSLIWNFLAYKFFVFNK